MKFTHRPPPVARLVGREKRIYTKALYEAAQRGTDQGALGAQRRVKAKIAAVGLGRLAGAVGKTSSKAKGQRPRSPYGAIFVKGGDESRAGQALESYSRGAVIRARKGNWLAFATAAVPRVIGRRRTTPSLYRKSGMVARIGELIFRPTKNPNVALLVVRKVTLHPRTHQAKRAGPRTPRTRVPADEVTAFVLLRVTRRAMRFNKDREVAKAARGVPDRIAFELDRLLARAA